MWGDLTFAFFLVCTFAMGKGFKGRKDCQNKTATSNLDGAAVPNKSANQNPGLMEVAGQRPF